MYLHVSGYRHLHFNQGEVSHAGTRSFKQLLFQQQLILIASEPSFHKLPKQENAGHRFPTKLLKVCYKQQ